VRFHGCCRVALDAQDVDTAIVLKELGGDAVTALPVPQHQLAIDFSERERLLDIDGFVAIRTLRPGSLNAGRLGLMYV